MQKQVDKNIIQDVAIELGISPSFVEKDLYAVKILKELASVNYSDAKLIFTGGTCLSKGYNLIKRFSEDIDFRIVTNPEFTRTQRRDFRNFIIDKIKTIPDIEFLGSTLESKNSSNFFSFYVKYPKNFEIGNALRGGLKLEFTFENVLLPTTRCQIEPIVAHYIEDLESTEIDCISPIEIGADKLSALVWRIDIKDRTKEEGSSSNDATIIRHLHDLAALEKLILQNKFKTCIEYSFSSDSGRGGANKNIGIIEFVQQTLNKLKTDKLYAKEYNEFVESLSYAQESEAIDFQTAIQALERIIDFIK